MNEGWICHRCGKANAPFIGSCKCKPDKVANNAHGECGCGGKHKWHIMSGWSNADGSACTFICEKCKNVQQFLL